MKNLFVPYNLALKLKELGFDEECFTAYRNTDGEEQLMNPSKWTNSGVENTHDGYCTAPTYSQAFKWFRDTHQLYHQVTMFGNYKKPQFHYYVSGQSDNGYHFHHMFYLVEIDSYENGEYACLRQLILLKHKYPFLEGDDYWTIDNNTVIKSCWDDISEELYDANPTRKYYKTELDALKDNV